MDNLIATIFWLSLFLLVYPYLLYPALMFVVSTLWKHASPPPGDLPSVSVIVAAYNEEEWITRKIESTLSQDYAEGRLELIVVSDSSTDRTDELVAAYQNPRTKLLVQKERAGKSVALNAGVKEATGEILVFTDANALFAPGTIKALAGHFTDPEVGLVSGQGLYRPTEKESAEGVANTYVRLEAIIKRGESAFGFIAGADGAIYAMRRELYHELAPTQVNDLLHPIIAALAGYRSIFEPKAYTIEPPSSGAGQEFQRHIRIIAQGFSIVFATAPRIVFHRQWRALWMLCSHRLIRWGSVLGLLGVFAASMIGDSSLYMISCFAQSLFFIMASVGWAAAQLGRHSGLIAGPYYFCVISAAGLLGIFHALRGSTDAVWSPRGGDMLNRAGN